MGRDEFGTDDGVLQRQEFFNGIDTRVDLEAAAERLRARLERDGYGCWIAELRESGAFAGGGVLAVCRGLRFLCVVAWEIAIKHGNGNLPLPLAPPVYVASRMKALGFMPPIHSDPAQAQVEGLIFVTRDAHVLTYISRNSERNLQRFRAPPALTGARNVAPVPPMTPPEARIAP